VTAPLIGDVAVEVTDWFEQLQVQQGLTFSLDKQALKFRNEALEFAAEPERMDEAADVMISLLGTLWMQGKDLADLAQAVADKLAVLRLRTWATAADGTYQHVPEPVWPDPKKRDGLVQPVVVVRPDWDPDAPYGDNYQPLSERGMGQG